jgi:hypothetical protein
MFTGLKRIAARFVYKSVSYFDPQRLRIRSDRPAPVANNFSDNFHTLDMSRTGAIGQIKMFKKSRACLIFHS